MIIPYYLELEDESQEALVENLLRGLDVAFYVGAPEEDRDLAELEARLERK